MKRRVPSRNYGAYPTDEYGFAIPLEETRVPYIEDPTTEVHHYNFYARSFGSLAIAQTFRDLQSQQIVVPRQSHVRLHQMYQGIQLPPVANMLDEIEYQHYMGGKLHIRAPYIGYQQHDITPDLMDDLYAEYNAIM